jgi:TIR domain
MADIFICYRHDDSAGWVQALYNELKGRFGPRRVFIDHDIPGGTKFPVRIMNEIQRASVFLVVIGKDWLPASTWDRSRLESPDDWVRQEIAAALKRRKINIIPVLVHGASMPERTRLPQDLAPLLQWNAVHVRPNAWDQNVAELFRMIEKLLPEPAAKGRTPGAAKRGGTKQGTAPVKAGTTTREGTRQGRTGGRKKPPEVVGSNPAPPAPRPRKQPATKTAGTSGPAKDGNTKRPSTGRGATAAHPEKSPVSKRAAVPRPAKSSAAPPAKRATQPVAGTPTRQTSRPKQDGKASGGGAKLPKKPAVGNSRKKR